MAKLNAKEIKEIKVRYTFVRDDPDQEPIEAALDIEFQEHMVPNKKLLLELHKNVSQAFEDLIEEEIE